MLMMNPPVTIEIKDSQRFAEEGWCFAKVTARAETDDRKAVEDVEAMVQVRVSGDMTLQQIREAAKVAALAAFAKAAEVLRDATV